MRKKSLLILKMLLFGGAITLLATDQITEYWLTLSAFWFVHITDTAISNYKNKQKWSFIIDIALLLGFVVYAFYRLLV